VLIEIKVFSQARAGCFRTAWAWAGENGMPPLQGVYCRIHRAPVRDVAGWVATCVRACVCVAMACLEKAWPAGTASQGRCPRLPACLVLAAGACGEAPSTSRCLKLSAVMTRWYRVTGWGAGTFKSAGHTCACWNRTSGRPDRAWHSHGTAQQLHCQAPLRTDCRMRSTCFAMPALQRVRSTSCRSPGVVGAARSGPSDLSDSAVSSARCAG